MFELKSIWKLWWPLYKRVFLKRWALRTDLKALNVDSVRGEIQIVGSEKKRKIYQISFLPLMHGRDRRAPQADRRDQSGWQSVSRLGRYDGARLWGHGYHSVTILYSMAAGTGSQTRKSQCPLATFRRQYERHCCEPFEVCPAGVLGDGRRELQESNRDITKSDINTLMTEADRKGDWSCQAQEKRICRLRGCEMYDRQSRGRIVVKTLASWNWWWCSDEKL